MFAKETLRKWLAEGENNRAVRRLMTLTDHLDDPDYVKEICSQCGRFNTLVKDWTQGHLDEGNYQQQLNNIRLALLDLVEKLPDGLALEVAPGCRDSSGNATPLHWPDEERAIILLDPTPALATGKNIVSDDPLLDDPILGEIINSCILSLEIKLRTMANHYFDENGFERPPLPGVFFIQSYLTLQALELERIEATLRATSPDHHDFFQQVKSLWQALSARCTQLTSLLAKSPCKNSSLSSSLQKTVLWLEELEDSMPQLITDRSDAAREAFKSRCIIPLADEMHRLTAFMAAFDEKQARAADN